MQSLSTTSANSKTRPALDFFEPLVDEFRPVPEWQLRPNETTLLGVIRRLFPDAMIAEREADHLYLVSESARLAFQIPTFDLSRPSEEEPAGTSQRSLEVAGSR